MANREFCNPFGSLSLNESQSDGQLGEFFFKDSHFIPRFRYILNNIEIIETHFNGFRFKFKNLFIEYVS
jgi:hypothetical protein